MATDAMHVREQWRRERGSTRPLPRPLPFDPEWRCPVHDRRVERVSSRSGLTYPGCDQCHTFARLTLTLAEVDRLTQSRRWTISASNLLP